ncbi:MAG TPA: hypothetical protein VJQ60_11910 [Arthrobacter sp.]|nr:hypothetical protein [Arthrobacter sp.]
MQVLYVVDFDLEPRRPGGDPYEAALASVASWLSYVAAGQVAVDELRSGGRLELQSYKVGARRTATWDAIDAASVRAIRVEVRDEEDGSGAVFVTRLTLGKIGPETTVRISLARESSPTWLSPAPPADLHQPGIVRSLLDNEDIELSISGQRQDGRYLQVRTDDEVNTLIAAIRSSARLPILLVHTRTLPAQAASGLVAKKLVGLLRVVTLDYRASRFLDDGLPGYAPPHSGARLIWSDPCAPTVPIDDLRVNAENPEPLRAYLMRLLAPVSVLARGVDRAYREARRADIAQKDRDARARSQQALSGGNAGEQLRALQAELEAARASADEWQQLASDEEDRANRFQGEAAKVPALEAQVEQLSIALRARPDIDEEDEATDDPWNELPPLETGSVDSAQNLFLYLEDAASSHIVFTDRAASSWKKSKYPFPEEMAEDLAKLARAAIALYDGGDRSFPHLDMWMRDEFDLRVALNDDTIEKDSKLRDFSYSGTIHNRTPHVKVRDYAPPSQVGRIHFALDSDNARLIVDHVGLKLY